MTEYVIVAIITIIVAWVAFQNRQDIEKIDEQVEVNVFTVPDFHESLFKAYVIATYKGTRYTKILNNPAPFEIESAIINAKKEVKKLHNGN